MAAWLILSATTDTNPLTGGKSGDGQQHRISQVFSDMTGWKELTRLVNEARNTLPEEERGRSTFFAERNYGYAGAIHIYGHDPEMPDAITFLDSYTLWAPDSIPTGPVIYVNYAAGGMAQLFGDIKEAGSISDPWFREKGLKVFICMQPVPNLSEVYAARASAAKAVYRRSVRTDELPGVTGDK